MRIATVLAAGLLTTVLLPASANSVRPATQTPSELTGATPPAGAIWLDSLDVSTIQQGWGQPHAGQSVGGSAITLGQMVYAHGVGTHARSEFNIRLNGSATRFVSMVGVDAESGTRGSVVFQVWADGLKRASTPLLRGGDPPVLVSANLNGAKTMQLVVTDGGDGIDFDHADWAGAVLYLKPGARFRPTAMKPDVAPPRLIVPAEVMRPEIHYPRITGCTPGHPFLFLVPASGPEPLTYTARGLPGGLKLNRVTGIISGVVPHAGRWVATLTVSGPGGAAHARLTIIAGDHKLALTPPMGWNSWNVWAGNVNADRVKAAADAMSSEGGAAHARYRNGLSAHGFQYVNIDDTWEGPRDASGAITTNERFPDMAGLADYVHRKGLKLGIYSSPGPKTCGGYPGSWQHELQDAQTYASWGIDYLKYDWCSYGGVATGAGLDRLQKPYQVMHDALDSVNRDILFSLCQYGMGDVWKWGAQVGGNCWRTTGDINDSWGSLHGIYSSQNGHEKYAGPGHWNDPDMLVVGSVGWGNPHPSHLTPNEQILHISMWCLLSAPLLIGCDMTKMDSFTRALLTNDELIAINQDPLGKPAGRVWTDGEHDVWSRPLADGTRAVGLINAGPAPAKIAVTWSMIGLGGRQPVRDLWLHKNVGEHDGGYSVIVPSHGAVVLKIGGIRRQP
ncbi:MAG: NPCBM/NEW2 domain-containing protein [Armatimonadetes bacterium]|nr:NPCBM/NEW2 domain-containing protein [Armatimonadota bacterium]MDE2206273.1 NPCBM/NEW2 domain-containing protein [Armatimonadota bacterium]